MLEYIAVPLGVHVRVHVSVSDSFQFSAEERSEVDFKHSGNSFIDV